MYTLNMAILQYKYNPNFLVYLYYMDMVILMMAIASASRPDSSIPLTNAHLTGQWDVRKPYRKPPLPARKVRHWRGVFEHRDTPIGRRRQTTGDNSS